MTLLKPWTPEFPGAICFPADESNVLVGQTVKPTHLCVHTPEEEADNYFATPRWFAQAHPGREGSTNAAIDIHGFIWECVPPNRAPIANGVIGKPYPSGADPSVNLNFASRSIEVEGRAATIHLTCPRGSSQWMGLVKWCAFLCKKYGLDVLRIIGHRDVASNRSDPGTLNMAALRQDVANELVEEDDMKPEDIDARITHLLNAARTIADRFVRADGQDEVYEIISGRRVWLVSAEVAVARGMAPNMSNVRVVNAVQLLAWPEGQL